MLLCIQASNIVLHKLHLFYLNCFLLSAPAADSAETLHSSSAANKRNKLYSQS